MKDCVKFILDNGPEVAKQSWKEKMQGCPKMMLEIIHLAVLPSDSHHHSLIVEPKPASTVAKKNPMTTVTAIRKLMYGRK